MGVVSFLRAIYICTVRTRSNGVLDSVVRGQHISKTFLTPVIGQQLTVYKYVRIIGRALINQN